VAKEYNSEQQNKPYEEDWPGNTQNFAATSNHKSIITTKEALFQDVLLLTFNGICDNFQIAALVFGAPRLAFFCPFFFFVNQTAFLTPISFSSFFMNCLNHVDTS
jgi:hypothetical protein